MTFNKPHNKEISEIKYSPLYRQPCKASYGKLKQLVTPELVELCRNKKYIVIYGYTKSGKVIIGKELSKALDVQLIVSDDYKHLGWKQNLYAMREVVLSMPTQPFIIEGVQAGRFLRKGEQHGDFRPDIVIHLEINRESIEYCYRADGEAYKISKVHNFNEKFLDKIFYEWYDLQKFDPVTIINMETSFDSL